MKGFDELMRESLRTKKACLNENVVREIFGTQIRSLFQGEISPDNSHYNDPVYHSVDMSKLMNLDSGGKAEVTDIPNAVIITPECRQLLDELISEGQIYDLQDIVEATIEFAHLVAMEEEKRTNRYFFNGLLYGISERNKRKGESK